MKKIVSAMMIAAGMAGSASALAASTTIVNGAQILTTDCTLLAEPVILNLSNKVHGAYNCNLILSEIQVAACHEGGSRALTTVNCTGTDTDGDGVADAFTPSGCADATGTVDIADFKAYGGTSRGGAMGTYEMGANCTDGAVGGVSLFN